jgi:hypothetical protein
MAGGKTDPKLAAAVAQLRADFDAYRGVTEKNISEVRVDFTAALAGAVVAATNDIAAIRRDGQKQLDALKAQIDAVRDRLIMIAGPGNKI